MEKSKTVVLVHGFMDRTSKMRKLKRHLKQEGFEVHVIDLNPSAG